MIESNPIKVKIKGVPSGWELVLSRPRPGASWFKSRFCAGRPSVGPGHVSRVKKSTVGYEQRAKRNKWESSAQAVARRGGDHTSVTRRWTTTRSQCSQGTYMQLSILGDGDGVVGPVIDVAFASAAWLGCVRAFLPAMMVGACRTPGAEAAKWGKKKRKNAKKESETTAMVNWCVVCGPEDGAISSHAKTNSSVHHVGLHRWTRIRHASSAPCCLPLVGSAFRS